MFTSSSPVCRFTGARLVLQSPPCLLRWNTVVVPRLHRMVVICIHCNRKVLQHWSRSPVVVGLKELLIWFSSSSATQSSVRSSWRFPVWTLLSCSDSLSSFIKLRPGIFKNLTCFRRQSYELVTELQSPTQIRNLPSIFSPAANSKFSVSVLE